MLTRLNEINSSSLELLGGNGLRGMGVAVGMPVAQHPPHRSVLEELPHTALALGHNAKANQRVRMTNSGERKPPVHETFHPIPN